MSGLGFALGNLVCLILKQVLLAHNTFMKPKFLLSGHIYTLTVGWVLTTILFLINLGQPLFRATFKVILGSCLSLLLKWATRWPARLTALWMIGNKEVEVE